MYVKEKNKIVTVEGEGVSPWMDSWMNGENRGAVSTWVVELMRRRKTLVH